MIDMTPALRIAGCITLLALMTACSKKEEPSPANIVAAESAGSVSARPPPPVAMNMPAGDSEAKPAAPAPSLTAASTAQQMAGSATVYTDNERKFIRTASASFRVKDVYVAALGIEDTVASHGGFVVKNEISASGMRTERQPAGDGKLIELKEYGVQGQLTVRVPSARTQEFLRAIAGHVVFLDERKYAAHDAQFDLLRQKLDAVRNQETQAELGETLAEGGKLAQRADAIAQRGEAKSARDAALLAKKEFEDQVAFSTIALTLSQPSRVLRSEHVDVEGMFSQMRPGFASRLREQLRGGWEGTLDVLLALAGLWPLVLVAALGGGPVWRALRRRKKDVAPA